MTRLTRRQLVASAAALLGAPSMSLAQAAAVRIGAVFPRQGAFAMHGEAAALGAKVALDMAGNKVLGRPVELVVYDDPNPLGAQQNIRKLLQEDKVCAIMGGMNSASGLAIASLGAQSRVPTIIPQATVRDITGKDCDRFVFRTNAFTSVYTKLLARQLLTQGKNWYFLVGAYAYGEEVHQLMKAEVEAAGGKDVGSDATPLGTTDFSSYILKIRQARPDVIVLGIAGLDLAAFLKQYEEFGLRTPLAAVALGDEELWALQSGPKLTVGKFWHFTDPANSPEERVLNDAVVKATGHPATLGAVTSWISTRMLLAGIEKAKSLEPMAIVRGMEEARPSGVRGYYREWDHQMIRQPLVGQVRDKITNKYDPLVLLGKPLAATDVEALFGTRQDSACRMKA